MYNFNFVEETMVHLSSPLRLLHVVKRLSDFHLKPHSHNFFHIIFIVSGSINIDIKGTSYIVHENHAIILPPYVSHALNSKGEYTQIGIDVFDIEKNETCVLLKQTFSSSFSIIKMQLPPHILEDIIKSGHNLTKLNQLKLQNNAEFLLLSCIEQASDATNKSFRDRFLNMIVHDTKLTFTLPQMCSYLNISKSHLERLVRSEFECSAIEYYNKLKIMKACLLLQDSESSIRNIGEELGFYDESHFTRFFKQKMGITPSNYRNTSRTLS